MVHHNIHITDDAIIAAAVLSNRYIADRHLPDKAIDLIDEAASRLKMEIESCHSPLTPSSVVAQKVELHASRETDESTIERADEMEEDIANMEQECTELKAQWQAEKSAIEGISSTKERIEEATLSLNMPSSRRLWSCRRDQWRPPKFTW